MPTLPPSESALVCSGERAQRIILFLGHSIDSPLYHAAVSDPWCLDRRFREWIARDTANRKAPGLRRGLFLEQQRCYLPAGIEPGSATSGGGLGAKDVTRGDKLDPKRTVALVVRSGSGLAKCIQAVLRRTRGCGGESRQFEYHPRTGIQFRHAE